MNNPKVEKQPPVPPFVQFCCAAVPMVFDDSLSYYEALCAMWKYLDNTVKVINNNALITEDFIAKVNELHDYVENYFANLDVQEEINNKLDQMALDGTLQEIIGDYLNATAVWGFDTVADLKASTNLINGSYAKTLGYSVKNDGGGATYKITDTADASEWQETLDSGLYATLIGELSPENTNLPVDTLINNWNSKDLVFGKNKSYTTTATITIRDVKTYDFNGSTITYDGDSVVEDVINIGYDNHSDGVIMRKYAGIHNLNINCNSKARNGLHISGGKALLFEDIDITKPLNYGLLADNSVGQCWELNLNRIQANAANDSEYHQGYSAIKITDVTDSNFTDLYPINGSVAWLQAKTSMSSFSNIHGYKYPDTADYIQTQGFKFENNRNTYSNIIVDTADSIGITASGSFNKYEGLCLYIKAGGKGIVTADSNDFDGISVHRALATVIEKATGGNYLRVSGIACEKQSGAVPTTDIAFLDNKLPKLFSYDWSARVVSPLKNNFTFTGTVNAGSPTASIALPLTLDNNAYAVNVMLDKVMPFAVTSRTTTGFTLEFNDDDITSLGSVTYRVHVTPFNGTN